MDKFAAASGDASVLALDDAADMSPFGVTPVASIDAGIVLLAIRALRAAVSIPVTSLLLIGDDSVIPFWRISNPVTDRQIDPDPVVLTDNPYGTAATLRISISLLPSLWAAARLQRRFSR